MIPPVLPCRVLPLIPLVVLHPLAAALLSLSLFRIPLLSPVMPNVWAVLEACIAGAVSSCHAASTVPLLSGGLGTLFTACVPPQHR